MLARSTFLQKAVQKPIYTYALTLLSISPLHCLGMLFGCFQVFLAGITGFFQLLMNCFESNKKLTSENASGTQGQSNNSISDSTSNSTNSGKQYRTANTVINTAVVLGVFSLWPLCTLLGLTFIGYKGAGYQSRFLAPILPSLSILVAVCISQRRGTGRGTRDSASFSLLWLLLLCYSSMLCLYYGFLYAPLFADVEVDLADIATFVLSYPNYSPTTKQEYQSIFEYLQHFGLYRKIV